MNSNSKNAEMEEAKNTASSNTSGNVSQMSNTDCGNKAWRTDDELMESAEKQTEELRTYEEVEGTPFQIVTEKGESIVTLGKYRLSAEKLTLEEAREDAERFDWFRLMEVMTIMIKEQK